MLYGFDNSREFSMMSCMHLSPSGYETAIIEIRAGRCPRHVVDLPQNPDLADQRDDSHNSEFAKKLLQLANQYGEVLEAFPGSEILEAGSPDDTSPN